MQFTPAGMAGTTYELGLIELGLRLVSGANVLNATILSNSGGTPGSIIETVSFNGLLDPSGASSLISANASGLTQLTAGTIYWLALSTDGAGTQVSWNSITGMTGTKALKRNTDPWVLTSLNGDQGSGMGAFRLSEVPEPGSGLLFLVAALGGLSRRRRTGKLLG